MNFSALPEERQQELKDLSERLSGPGVDALYKAAKRIGFQITKRQVGQYVRSKPAKQEFSQQQPSQGKTAAGSLDERWQCDVMIWYEGPKVKRRLTGKTESKVAKRHMVYYLVCVNVFDRFLYVAPVPSREPESIILALRSCLDRAPKKPMSISSDMEFASNKVKAFFRNQGIEQRFKQPGEGANSIAVVDRAIGLIKRRLAEKAKESDETWSNMVDEVVKNLNETPKPEVLHGAAPEEVRDHNPEARFLLQQDNAQKLKHNHELNQKRTRALEAADGRFRAPTVTRSAFKRTFDPSFQSRVLRSDGIRAGRVSVANSTKSYSLKSIRPVVT